MVPDPSILQQTCLFSLLKLAGPGERTLPKKEYNVKIANIKYKYNFYFFLVIKIF